MQDKRLNTYDYFDDQYKVLKEMKKFQIKKQNNYNNMIKQEKREIKDASPGEMQLKKYNKIALDEDVNLDCMLCQRQMPIFVNDSETIIMHLPERFLPQFLLNLKREYINQTEYLRYLHINSKRIRVCACE